MPEIINPHTVADAKSLMKEKFPLVVAYFFEDAAMYLNEMNEGIAENNLEKIKTPAHTIKSSSSQLGAEKISDIAKQIEAISNDMLEGGVGDIAQLRDLFEQLKLAVTEAEPELRKLV